MESKKKRISKNLSQWVVLYHISALMRYNCNGWDNSVALLDKGVIPHQGRGVSEQENGFFVWTSSKKAISHSFNFAWGDRSLVTLKVPADSIRFPDWKFDVEGLHESPFLLDGLCAKHHLLVEKIFQQPDFRREMRSIIGNRCYLKLENEPMKPYLMFFDKQDDLIGITDDFDSNIGSEMMFQAEMYLSEMNAEKNRVAEASQKGIRLPEYGVPLNRRALFQLLRDETFLRKYLSRFADKIRSLNYNNSVMEALREVNLPYASKIARFDLCLRPSRMVVQKYIGSVKLPLGEKDIVYERILNALLRRCPAMQKSYNELLNRQVASRSIIFMARGIPYAPAPFFSFPLKYTGDTSIPVFSITKLSPQKNKHNRIYALSRPIFNQQTRTS